MEKKELFWLDGWIDGNRLKMSENRAFLFGDGFFETMRWQPDRTCLLWPQHWERLTRTLKALQFPVPANFTESFLKSLIQNQLEPDSGADFRVKLVFWRQGTGKYNPENTKLAFMLTLEPYLFPWIQAIQNVGLAETVFIPKQPLSWIKTTSSMLYVAASMEREKRKLDDVVLRNQNGFVIEGSYSCLFWAKGETLFLPDADLGGLDSCMRQFLIRHWTREGIPFQMVREKWNNIPNVDWIGFGSGMGLRILKQKNGAEPETLLPKFD